MSGSSAQAWILPPPPPPLVLLVVELELLLLLPHPAATTTASAQTASATGNGRRVKFFKVPPSAGENESSALQADRPFSTGYQCAGEVVRVERPQVVQALADSDQLHGQAELVRDRDRDPALGRAVELGEGNARNADRL